MKELNYQYKIIEEKNINGKVIFKIQDDIYDKIVFMELYKEISSDDWTYTNKTEQEIGKLKDNREIDDYFINDDYSKNLKFFYKIYNNYDGFDVKKEEDSSLETPLNTEVEEIDNSLSFSSFSKDSQSLFDEGLRDSEMNLSRNIYDRSLDNINEVKQSKDNYIETVETVETITETKTQSLNPTEKSIVSYTSKSNEAELERIRNLNKTTNKTTYNSYSNLNISRTPKKGGGAGWIFFFVIISIVAGLFFVGKSNSDMRKKDSRSRYSNYYRSKNNYEKASNYFKKKSYYSAEIYYKSSCNYDKNKDACSMLGYLYENGKVYKVDKYKEAVDYYVKGCELGDTHSCKQAGYLSRINLKDNNYAIKYYGKGCDLKDDFSCTDMGFLYETSFKDMEKAKDYYLKGCELKNKVACYNIALIYHYDKVKGVKDIELAKKYYEKSCRLGYKKACNIKYGENTDKKEVVERKKENLDVETIDDVKKLFTLAQEYDSKKDYSNSNLLYAKACTKGDLKSCNNLGYHYQKGMGFNQSNLMAKKYFSETCEKDSSYGCNKIGYFYEMGIEFKKDLKKSRIFYKKSCNLNYGLACANLAKIYKYAKGVEKDEKIANILFRKACKLGDKESCRK